MQALQSEILEAIARGVPFDRVATLLCQRIEGMTPSAMCTIVRIDDGRLRPVAAPSMPASYSEALEGVAIGPSVGSCGTAAFLGRAVEVRDIETDPLWADYRALALPLGLRACWSSPIKGSDGKVVATFAFYYRTNRGPSDLERSIVETCLHVCAIGVEHADVQERNHRLAYYDQLTNLPNRRCFDETIAERLGQASPSFGLLLIDIDHFKSINDTMGHMAGDRVIQEVAARFGRLDVPVSAFRMAGDEFAVLVDPCDDHDALRQTALVLLEMIRMPVNWDGSTIIPQATIGGVVHGLDGVDADTLRQNADFALYHAKEIGRGSYLPFNPGLRTSIVRRFELIRAVDEALNEDRIHTFYQPLVRLDTAEIIGVEALARLKSRDGQIINAGAFQPAFSDPIVAHRLTERTIARVAADVAQWLDAGIAFQHVGVNLSTVDFGRNDIERRLTDAFTSAGVSLKHVILEVTESVFLDGPEGQIARAVQNLRTKGMLVALDDFGTGFASLTHLINFPVDIIKIDKSFIDRLLTDQTSSIVVEALIELALKLEIKIVAEGIETAAQAERLQIFGCRIGQGYHYGQAADAATTTRLLKEFAQPQGSIAEQRRRPERVIY